jgi:hypothetical protein
VKRFVIITAGSRNVARLEAARPEDRAVKRFVIITAALLYAVVDYVAAFTFLIGAAFCRYCNVQHRGRLTNGKPLVWHDLAYAEPERCCPRSSVPLHDAIGQPGREAG